MRRLILWMALACACAAPAAAQEKPPVADAVAALSSDDPKRREAALATLAASDASDVPSAAADALSRARAEWPAGARARLEGLVHDLRAATPLPEFQDLGSSPPDVAEKVRDAVAKYDVSPRGFRTPNPDAEAIAKLGRAALPALVAALRDRTKRGMDFGAWVAGDALAGIVGPDDVPLLARLLAEGHGAAARGLAKIESDAATDALVAAVERDVFDNHVLDVLRERGSSRRAALAVLGWMERRPDDYMVASAADFVGRAKCADAVPVLAAAIEASPPAVPRAHLAAALARLGDKRGIAELVDLMESGRHLVARNDAGEALNEIAGRNVFVGTYDSNGPTGNFDDAARQFRAWWNDKGDALVFDAAAGRWHTGDEPVVDLPESPPDVAEKVRAILRPLGSGWSAFNPETDELVKLGRPAVGELLRSFEPDSAHGRSSGRSRVAADALASLLKSSDVLLVARLLLEGKTAAAPALSKLHGDASRDALLAPVAKGFLSFELVEALRPYAAERAVRAALGGWLEEYAAQRSSLPGNVADLLAREGSADALPALRKAAGAAGEYSRPSIASALARLGDRGGIELLIRAFDDGGIGQPVISAGEALNAVVGRKVWVGGWSGPGGESHGNLDEARREFHAWWDASKDELRFDPASRRWTTGDEAPAPDAGTSPPEVVARVDAILAKGERQGLMVRGDVFEELASLGRDAFPALVARLRATDPDDISSGGRSSAIAAAIGRLRTDADVELLASLLREGHREIADSLAECADPRARAALLTVLAAGEDDMTVMHALARTPADAATWEALRAWLKAPGAKTGNWVGDYVEKAATPEAMSVLREVLAAERVDTVMRVRCASALASIGGRDGVEALLAMVGPAPFRAQPNVRWSQDVREMAAERLNSIFGERIYVAGDEAPAYAALAVRFAEWWRTNGKSFTFDAASRTWGVGPRRIVELAAVPPELAAQAEALVGEARAARRFFTFSPRGDIDPHAQALVDLGHDVFPFLVAAVRRTRPWGRGEHGTDNGALAVAQAICVVAQDEDRPAMLALLAEGRLAVAAWFKERSSPEARDVALDVVRRGWLDESLLAMLRPFSAEKRVHDGLLAWAEKFGAGDDGAPVEGIAEILGTPAEGTTEPRIADVLARPTGPRLHGAIAAQLAKHGSKPALATLVSAMEDAALSDKDAVVVARALDAAAGTEVAEIGEPPREKKSFDPSRPSRRMVWFAHEPDAVLNRPDAAKRFRAWWTENADRLRFDAAAGRWTTSK